MGERYRHEICFIGPQDAAGLIEAAERVGFELESVTTKVDENLQDATTRRDEAQADLKALRTRLADRRGEPSD